MIEPRRRKVKSQIVVLKSVVAWKYPSFCPVFMQ